MTYELLIWHSLAVFAIVLLITKSKIYECKRDFVEKRYLASFVANQKPNIAHWWWYHLNTCAMCCGFWVALVFAVFRPVIGFEVDTLVLFGLNWLWHCIEDALVSFSSTEKKSD